LEAPLLVSSGRAHEHVQAREQARRAIHVDEAREAAQPDALVEAFDPEPRRRRQLKVADSDGHVLRAAETVEESRLDVALDRDPDALLERDLVLVEVACDVRPREHGALPRPSLVVLLLKETKF